jgi:hypothetical protein
MTNVSSKLTALATAGLMTLGSVQAAAAGQLTNDQAADGKPANELNAFVSDIQGANTMSTTEMADTKGEGLLLGAGAIGLAGLYTYYSYRSMQPQYNKPSFGSTGGYGY